MNGRSEIGLERASPSARWDPLSSVKCKVEGLDDRSLAAAVERPN
jgi:hypothetical protein